MEKIIKNYDETKNAFKITQDGDIIRCYNRMNQEFHFIDTSFLKEGILLHGWKGFRTADQLKEVLEGHLYEIFSKNSCSKMLIDNRNMSGSFSSVNDWLANDYMPKLVSNGLMSNAVVLPNNIFAKLAVEDWDRKINGFSTRNFDDTEKALAWLRS